MMSERLAALLSHEALPWGDATGWHIEDFLKAFTSHDSLWLSLLFDTAWHGSATAVISLDSVWNETGQEATSDCTSWPTLFIRFEGTTQIVKENYTDIGGIQRGISDVTTTAVQGGLFETVIRDHYGGKVVLRHSPRIFILCYSSADAQLNLAGKAVEQTVAADRREDAPPAER